MASQFDTFLADDFDHKFDVFKEPITRFPHGKSRNSERVLAVIERDGRAAGDNTTEGGLVENNQGVRIERRWLIEVDAKQEVSYDDQFVIDGGRWRVLGDSIGSDGGSKTFVVMRKQEFRQRQPRTNR